jgi:D-aspartate ligase
MRPPPANEVLAVTCPTLQPVILGGDIGAYSLARAYHEAFGVRSIVVSSVSTGVVRHSRILTSVVEPGMDDDAVVVHRLHRIAAQHAGKRLLLLASADRLVDAIVRNRDRLEDRYTVPYPAAEQLDLVTDKERFGELCRQLAIPHPPTVVHDVGAGATPDTASLTFPVVAKTANTAAYHQVDFVGKQKVFVVDTPRELAALLDRIRAAGYRDRFLIQDVIPGDDSGMRILTCYSDRSGRVRFSAFGHVLLEDHAPGAVGNPVGIITDNEPIVVEHARRLLETIGWTGYANFDLKYDPRDGRYVFFELNPRLGRSNYYLTAAGQNAVTPYVREYLAGLDPLPPGAPEESARTHLYTVVPRRLLLRSIADPALRARTRALFRRRRATNPLWYGAERDPRRLAYLAIAQLNQFRKFRIHRPLALTGSTEETS